MFLPRLKFFNGFLAPALCFFALRFLILWTGVERVSFYDELDLGTSARCILQGLNFSFWDYQLDFYAGESLLLAFATVPFFKFMGMNLLALKMVPFLFSFLTLALTWFFLKRFFGGETAKKGGWLLVLCPPVFAQLSLVVLSGHTEALLWSIGSVVLFYEFLYGEHPLRTKPLFFFGVLSGLGAWFHYTNLIMTFTCLLAWALIDRKSFLSWKPGIFLIGFLAGFTPWLIYNAKDPAQAGDFWAFSRLGPYYAQPLMRALRKILKLVFFGIPSSFALQGIAGIPERFISFVHWFFFWVPAVLWGGFVVFKSLRGDSEKKRFLPLGLFPFVFFGVFMFVGFDVQPGFHFTAYRYLTPLIFWSLVLFSILLGQLGKKGTVWWAVMLALGFLGQTGFVFREPAGRALQYKGYSYYHAAVYWQNILAYRVHHFEDLEKLAAGFSPLERYYFYWGLSEAGAWMDEPRIFRGQIGTGDFLNRNLDREYPFLAEWAAVGSSAENEKAAFVEASSMAEFRRAYFLRGWLDRWWRIPSLLESPDLLQEFPPTERAWAYRSLGGHLYNEMTGNLRSFYWKDSFYFFFNTLKREDGQRIFKKIGMFPDREQDWIYEGAGRFRRTDGMDGHSVMGRPFQVFFEAVPLDRRPALFRGLGWGIREIFREDTLRARDWIQALPEEGRAPALEGMRQFEEWYHVPAE